MSRSRTGAPERNPTAHLFVGRFVEKKGITVLADAMRLLRAQGDQTPVTCVGDGPLRPILETLARDVPGVTLTGWLSPDAVRERMTQAVSLVVPSIIAAGGDAEGLPSVIPEAMAQACPVIGSNLGGIAEAIVHNHTGLLVPPNDPAALAARHAPDHRRHHHRPRGLRARDHHAERPYPVKAPGDRAPVRGRRRD